MTSLEHEFNVAAIYTDVKWATRAADGGEVKYWNTEAQARRSAANRPGIVVLSRDVVKYCSPWEVDQ